MRGSSLVLTFVLPIAAACGSVKQLAADASPAGDARATDAPPPDAPPPDAPTCPTRLLTGGTDIAPQGWSLVMQAPAQLANGPDYVKLQTATNNGALSGGQLLITYPRAVEMGKPFKLQVVMLVETVNPHNPLDSAAAILGSFTPPFGAGNDRNQMIYLDSGKIGWADDTQSFAVTVTDNAYHTYELSVDAGGAATVSVDGIQALTRNGFTTNGAIAIGDQTNDPNVDSTLRIRSVTRLCL
ncbi:MAG TPA: hypothetical protein VHT91_06325 [Kofleriaceae bacterium]|nr:hypothetical protein [Kofleriaceae bacterium]